MNSTTGGRGLDCDPRVARAKAKGERRGHARISATCHDNHSIPTRMNKYIALTLIVTAVFLGIASAQDYLGQLSANPLRP